jgi:hypothetical protein
MTPDIAKNGADWKQNGERKRSYFSTVVFHLETRKQARLKARRMRTASVKMLYSLEESQGSGTGLRKDITEAL